MHRIAAAFALWGCTSDPPPPVVAIPSPPAEPAAAPEQRHVALPYHEPQSLPEVGGTVTLIEGSRDTISDPDGGFYHGATIGRLQFTDGDEETTILFTSGQSFQHAGRDMAVYGEMSLELVIAPPGLRPHP